MIVTIYNLRFLFRRMCRRIVFVSTVLLFCCCRFYCAAVVCPRRNQKGEATQSSDPDVCCRHRKKIIRPVSGPLR